MAGIAYNCQCMVLRRSRPPFSWFSDCFQVPPDSALKPEPGGWHAHHPSTLPSWGFSPGSPRSWAELFLGSFSAWVLGLNDSAQSHLAPDEVMRPLPSSGVCSCGPLSCSLSDVQSKHFPKNCKVLHFSTSQVDRLFLVMSPCFLLATSLFLLALSIFSPLLHKSDRVWLKVFLKFLRTRARAAVGGLGDGMTA